MRQAFLSGPLRRLAAFLAFALLPVSWVSAETLIFSAPPRESAQKGEKTYSDIARYLSKVLNRNIVYRHPGNWLSYSADMRSGKYDLVFDGPHFVSWRINKLKHTPLIKIPGDFVFYFLARKDNNKVSSFDDLVGKRVCGHAPPNQGTLRLYDQFKNPMRLPILVQVKGWRNIYQAMLDGKCEVAIVPGKIYKKVEPNRDKTKVIYQSSPVSGQAITASNKFSAKEIWMMQKALLEKEGIQATKNLRERFASPTLVAATRAEYNNVYTLLDQSYGYGFDKNLVTSY